MADSSFARNLMPFPLVLASCLFSFAPVVFNSIEHGSQLITSDGEHDELLAWMTTSLIATNIQWPN